MSLETTRKVIISLETAINGGSLSIIESGREIDAVVGGVELSRSDFILESLYTLLIRNNICRNEIEKICVSEGPGSLTGIRIGLATALGIGNALKKEVFGLSILEAMRVKSSMKGNCIIAFHRLGGEVYFAEYVENGKYGAEKRINYRDFIKKIQDFACNRKSSIVLTNELAGLIEDSLKSSNLLNFNKLKIVKVKGNFANIIAMAIGC